MKKKLLDLQKQREALLGKIDALISKGEAEKRDLTEAEGTEITGHKTEIRSIDAKIVQTRELLALRDEQDKLAAETRGFDTGGTPRSLAPADAGTQGVLSDKEMRSLQEYSYVRAIRGMLNNNGRLDGLEKEMHQEALLEMRATGAEAQGNFCVPQKVLQLAGLQQRSITATGTTSVAGDQGGLAIQTNVGSIIERFYAKLMVKQMGSRVLDGLVGNVLFPRHVTDDQAVVKGENTAAAVSSSTMNSISMSPRRVPVVLEISRQFSMQTSPSVESYLRDDLAFQIAKIIDQYCINGSGSANQPKGILNVTGITQNYAGATVSITNSVPTITAPAVGTNANGAALSYADLILLVKALAVQNADLGKLGFLTNPNVKASLQLTPKIGSTFPTFVWPDAGDNILGYRAGVTTQMPSNTTKGASGATLSSIIFANWDDALLAQWGGMDMLINPYSKDDQGLIRINAWTFFDFNVRRPLSFAAITDVVA